jgi:two-component system, OmpR family, copper resistance phosphate regulon response regulator CusR
MRILVVEDEKRLASFVKKGLEEQSYAVDVVSDGEEGEYLAFTNEYDLIILDILLPLQDGWKTCENIRNGGLDIPIIMLTAMDGVTDRVKGLDYGADDYISKPFEFEELLARVRAHLRRRYRFNKQLLEIGGIQLDTHARRVLKGGKAIDLTNKEFALLEYLMLNIDRVVTRTMIAEHVWDLHFDAGSNVIDVMVNYLRKKVEAGNGEKIIHTVRGSGYTIKS